MNLRLILCRGDCDSGRKARAHCAPKGPWRNGGTTSFKMGEGVNNLEVSYNGGEIEEMEQGELRETGESGRQEGERWKN